MKKRRYRELFEIRQVTDRRTGKTRREAFYTGQYYRIEALETSRFRTGLRLMSGILLFTGVLLGYLFTDLPSTHCLYALPFALMIPLPLMYEAMAAWRILRLPQRFTEVQRDRSLLSFSRSAYGLAALSACYALGITVLILTGGAGAYAWAEAGWAAGLLAAGAWALRSGKWVGALDAGRAETTGR
jgi:hypothetical protein